MKCCCSFLIVVLNLNVIVMRVVRFFVLASLLFLVFSLRVLFSSSDQLFAFFFDYHLWSDGLKNLVSFPSDSELVSSTFFLTLFFVIYFLFSVMSFFPSLAKGYLPLGDLLLDYLIALALLGFVLIVGPGVLLFSFFLVFLFRPAIWSLFYAFLAFVSFPIIFFFCGVLPWWFVSFVELFIISLSLLVSKALWKIAYWK